MDTEEKILESALNIFVAKGFSASTGEITKAAGVSTGILFHYFPTKNDLIIALYERCLLENFQVWFQTFVDFNEDNPPKFKEAVKIGWQSSVNWGLGNWPKFQFIKLFDSSVLADQFEFDQNQDIRRLYETFNKVNQFAIDHHLLKEVAAAFNIEISRAVIATTTEFLYHHPEYSQDRNFMERVWLTYWTAVGG
jgi:AcrR family transcriptional regulator